MDNYFVAHVQKFKGVDIRGLEIHLTRSSPNLSNKDIDSSRTADNYDLLDNGTSFHERIKKLVDSRNNPSGTALRKDAVQFCSVLVSASPDVFAGKSSEYVRRYFEAATEWLCREFGRETAVCSYVHFDEKTPHLHYCFVPLTDNNRLCCKEVINRNRLRKIQEDLPKYLQKLGFEIQRGIANSPSTHFDTKAWKREEYIRGIMAEELLKLVDIEKTPEKTLIRTKTGKVVVDPKDLEIVQEIALKEVQNRLEKRRENADQLRSLRNLKAETAKQLKALNKIQEKQAQEADRLTKQALEQKAEGERLSEYRKALEAQDKDLELQKLVDSAKRQVKMLDNRYANLLDREERLEETIRQGLQIGLQKALDRIALKGYEGNYMAEWKQKDPQGYEKAMQDQKRKAFAKANAEAQQQTKTQSKNIKK